MPKLKRKKAYAEATVTSFGGLRDDADSSSLGAVSIRNFCFRSDRTLEKRNGYVKEKEFGAPIRALWQSAKGNFAGRFYLAGSDIFYEDTGGGTYPYGQVQTSTGEANFFVYRGHLYLVDSSCIYCCNHAQNRFLPACGYAPLLGEHWNPATGTGSVHENPNLLSTRIRVSYDCPAGTRQIRLPYPAESIDAVTSNGVALAYSFTTGNRLLTLTNASAECTVEVAMTLGASYAPLRWSLLTCTLPFGFQKIDREYLYLTGGIEGYRVFSAATVSNQMLTLCQRAYPDADPLYFKSTGMLVLGDQDHPLRAFARHNGRVIAFGTSGAWSLTRADEGDTVEAYFLDCCPGCVAREGALSIGEELLVLTPQGLCSLRADSADKDHFSVTPLALELAKTFAGFDATRAILHYDSSKNRVLLRDTGETAEGLVYLYDRTQRLWTAWNHIPAARFFEIEQAIFFCRENKLFRFDDALYLDDGEAFTASYQSGAISFDTPEEYKRSLRFYCEVSADGEQLRLKVKTESSSAEDTRTCQNSDFPEHCECRVPAARFRNFCYRISFLGQGQAILHRVGFCATL